MMKEFIGFIFWKWRSFELWQKMFMFGMFIQGSGWTLGGTYGWWLVLVGMSIIGGYMTKWFVIDPIKESWLKYKLHRNQLLTTIKDSDR